MARPRRAEPWYQNIAWLGPLFWTSLAALAITVVLWPIATITRYRYGVPLRLEPRALRTLRLSRISALAILAGLAAWTGVLTLVFRTSSIRTTVSIPSCC
jgi:hypothetical protein